MQENANAFFNAFQINLHDSKISFWALQKLGHPILLSMNK